MKKKYSLVDHHTFNAYGVENFSKVKCVRCKQVYNCSSSGHGFCSKCDNFYLMGKDRSAIKSLLRYGGNAAVPAEWTQ